MNLHQNPLSSEQTDMKSFADPPDGRRHVTEYARGISWEVNPAIFILRPTVEFVVSRNRILPINESVTGD